MRFEIVTIFPGFFAGIFETGFCAARLRGLVTWGARSARLHSRPSPHRGRPPFGGGEGMVLKPSRSPKRWLAGHSAEGGTLEGYGL